MTTAAAQGTFVLASLSWQLQCNSVYSCLAAADVAKQLLAVSFPGKQDNMTQRSEYPTRWVTQYKPVFWA